MKIILKKKPKNPTIIEGFPGFGLVGTIASEFLIDHLKTEQIGKIWLHELPAMVAIHEGEVVEPIGIFYNKKYNIVIVHGIIGVNGLEWKITDAIVDMAKDLKAKEIISLEGIGSATPSEESKIFCYSSHDQKAKVLKKSGCQSLKEGIIMGTTGILLLKSEKTLPVTSIFAETHSELPDSKAAAKVIEVLDKYLGLKVDYKPLLQQAEKFETKLKELLGKSQKISEEQKKKRLSYVG
ncbi:PAC2 family protein [Candidatus Woesearchaeota archaeon]|nr:PAC2 family protein [Candidatus Woesearchaeota archaeon]